jgi:hypothetical protein
VTLQEANAVAVIDLTDGPADKPISLLPLASWTSACPATRPTSPTATARPTRPPSQSATRRSRACCSPTPSPASRSAATTYFVTANEGDSRIVAGPTEITLNEARASAVQAGAPADYARLNLDTVWSTPTDLYGFGGRGFSIFRQNADGSITKVEETGGDIEQIIAGLPSAGTVFNGENGAGFDTRSDNKGAEPEGVPWASWTACPTPS